MAGDGKDSVADGGGGEGMALQMVFVATLAMGALQFKKSVTLTSSVLAPGDS